jgi:hypothetical protein
LKKIWGELINLDKKILENKGYYEKLLEVHIQHHSLAEDQINLDLLRTFPNHPYFAKDCNGYNSLKRILIAYSWRNPLVSYVQSLNYLVGILLLHFSEIEAFWVFVSLIEEILPGNFYSPQLVGIRADTLVIF